jgi:hypothetical protein
MRYLVSSPAMDRLGWVLDGLNGEAGWGGDAADVLAPEFAALVPADRFAELVRQRAASFAPVTVIGLDVGDDTARARVRVRGSRRRILPGAQVREHAASESTLDVGFDSFELSHPVERAGMS